MLDCLAMMISSTYASCRSVDDVSFRNVIQCSLQLGANYPGISAKSVLSGRKAVRSNIERIFDKIRGNIVEKFKIFNL